MSIIVISNAESIEDKWRISYHIGANPDSSVTNKPNHQVLTTQRWRFGGNRRQRSVRADVPMDWQVVTYLEARVKITWPRPSSSSARRSTRRRLVASATQ